LVRSPRVPVPEGGHRPTPGPLELQSGGPWRTKDLPYVIAEPTGTGARPGLVLRPRLPEPGLCPWIECMGETVGCGRSIESIICVYRLW
jgi:hypothetical protein